MVRPQILLAAVAALTTAAPTQSKRGSQWQNWCSADSAETRVSFASMPPEERKAYTDAIYCIHSQPSNLDNSQFPAAVNRYQDYAVVHVERTGQVHLSGFFLTWHRYFLHLFEQDLRETCGYEGRFPYWDFAATASNLQGSAQFDGSPYSMGSDGVYNNTGPIALGPQLVIPHGTGGGCIKSGPFSDWTATLGFIDPLFLISGAALPPNTYAYNASCLKRDLNSYVAQTYTNEALVVNTVYSASASALEYNLNGVIGGSSLGVHSAGHFTVGGFMNSIHVSVQDPVWWMLHANIDRIYSSWQKNNPSIANEVYGTMTANNAPPSANVTLDTIEPDWGYFDYSSIAIGDLIDTLSGPFCYQYDNYIS
jgi:tyrosinase